MKYYIFLTFILLVSCNKKQITDFDSKDDLITYLEKLNPTEKTLFFKNQVVNIANHLNEATDLTLNFNFSIRGSITSNSEIDSIGFEDSKIEENPFIFINKDSVATSFNHYINAIKGYQKFLLPNSTFDIRDKYVYENSENVKYSYKKIYQSNKQIDSSKIGLIPIDSILIVASLTYPSSYDSIIISNGAEKKIYNNFTINVDTLMADEIVMDLPNELYNKYMDIRGVTKKGQIIKTNSFSALPNIGLNNNIKDNALVVQKLFTKYSQININDAVFNKFKDEFSTSDFQRLKLLYEYQSKILPKLMKLFKKTSNNFLEDYVKIQNFIEQNAIYFGPKSQTIQAIFPNNIDKVIVYFETESQKIIKEKMVYIKPKIPYTNIEQPLKYHTYYDSDIDLYGISDNQGKIVVKASFKDIVQKDDFFYHSFADNLDYYFNSNTLKIEPLSNGLNYYESINPNTAIFTKNEKKGVVQNITNEIVPFKYNNIEFINNTYVCEYSLRGRNYFDFYTQSGQLIKPDETIMASMYMYIKGPNDKTFIVKNNKRKYGVIDTNGKTIIPFIYEGIEALNFKSLMRVEKNNYEYEIIDINNNVYSIPAEVDYIKTTKTSENRIQFLNKNNVLGFLDENLKIIIPAQYKTASAFINGLALAIDLKNNFYIIDKYGKQIKKLEGLKVYYNNPEIITDFKTGIKYFNVDENYYDMNGNLVDPNKLYL